MATYKVVNGTSYDDRTPDSLVELLEQCRGNGLRLLVIYGDTQTGEAHGTQIQERGRIGRSTGTNKVPLLVKTSRSLGGEVLYSQFILQVRESKGGAVLWNHPNYKG